MKFPLFSAGVGLSLALGVSVAASDLLSKPQSVVAQGSAACPLSADIAVTFLNSQCKAVKLSTAQTFYRYYSSSSNKYGRYLTTDLYKINVDVIQKLALNQSWGNQATTLLKVTVPAGTTVYQGIVAPQTPASCYPGGGQQTFISDSKDPNIQWVDAESLQVKTFTCP